MLGHPFVAVHVAALYASAGDAAGLARCEEVVSAAPAGPDRDVSLAPLSALRDFVAGDHRRSTQTPAGLSREARIGIGGSNVERTLVDRLEASSRMRHRARVHAGLARRAIERRTL